MGIKWAVCGLACVASTLSASEEARKIETEINLVFASKYISNGVTAVNDPVFQPELSFSMSGFTLAFWGNVELTGWNAPNYDTHPRGRVTEIETTFEFASTWRDLNWAVGTVDYQFPGTGYERYREWYVGIGSERFCGSPTLTVYTGANDESGTYATFALSHSMPAKFGGATSVDVQLELTGADKRCCRFLYGHDGSGLTDLHVSAGTEFELGKGWTLSPSIHYSTLLQPGILRGQPRRTALWAACGISLKF